MKPPKVNRIPRFSTSLKSPSTEKKQVLNGNGCIRSPGTSSPGPSKVNGNVAVPLRNGRVRSLHSTGEVAEDDCKDVNADSTNKGRKRRLQYSVNGSGQPVVKKVCLDDDKASVEKIFQSEPPTTPTKFALAHIVTSKERQFKWAVRLYRYLNTKNSAFDTSSRSRLFLKRNLVYLDSSAWEESDSKHGGATLGPTYKKRRRPERTSKQKCDNLEAVIERIYKEVKRKHPFGSPTDRILGCYVARNELDAKTLSSLSGSSPRKDSFSEPTAVMKFIDVRNKDLPGSRRAKITVHTAAEIDGVFGEIHRLQAATTFMEVNVKRNKPIGIDLPRGIGILGPKHKKRNDYVILRVVFSEEENARVSGGRTLRCVPSRQAESAEPKATRRTTANKITSPSSANDDALVMYGARCIASVSGGDADSGIIYGDGSINLVPSEWLGTRNVLGRDGSNARKLLELGKKNHTGPFIKIFVASDAGEETSSSEEDDETRSCSTSRSMSVCSSRSKPPVHAAEPELKLHNRTEDSFQSFLKERFKRELSLQFPKEICYRFITRYNDEPDTSFPESVFRRISDLPPNWMSCSNSKELAENIVEGFKTPTKKPLAKEVDGISPLKELKRYNGVFCSPPHSVSKDASDDLKHSIRPGSGYKGKSRQHPSRLDSLASGFTLDELLSNESIEEYSLVETIDNCGAMGRFEKFFMPSPKKPVYQEDMVSYQNYWCCRMLSFVSTSKNKHNAHALAGRHRAAWDSVKIRGNTRRVHRSMHLLQFLKFSKLDSSLSSSDKGNSLFSDASGIVTRCIAPPNKCFFCLGTFPDMFALLLHLRTSYPRLDIVYRGDSRKTAAINRAAPVCVDVFLREDFDGSYEGSVSRQYRNFRDPNVSQRCVPNDRLTCLVLKGEARDLRKTQRDLSIFFSKADRDKRAMKGINSAYFGFRSRHPLMDSSRLTTKQIDQEWLRMYIIRQIEDFLDLSRLEKDFLILWNIFLLNLDHKPFGRCHLYRTCRLFLQKHRQDLLAKGLTTAWTLHLSAFHEREALDADEVYDLIMRMQDLNYDPEKDVCHIVYSTCQRQKAATVSKKEPRWPKVPVAGPKVFSLRSSSAVKLSAADTNSDNEELFKKIRESKEREERSSSYAGEERPKNGTYRRREPCLKYLSSPKIVHFLKNT